MKFNTDPTFVGLDILKQVHNSQISEFITWASTNNWGKFHSSHYDWWVFPINQPNGYGLKYGSAAGYGYSYGYSYYGDYIYSQYGNKNNSKKYYTEES